MYSKPMNESQTSATHGVRALAGVLLSVCLLALAVSLGSLARGALQGNIESPLQAQDHASGRVFQLLPGGSALRVLDVRAGVSEIARLSLPPQPIHALRYEPAQQQLVVETAGRNYRYDARDFQLIDDSALAAVSSRTLRD
ncbi:hypothetical protein [Uliginosibacterium sediminicola]|uniref:Uncharacterized protein n=1 Tax=Uliginosibacterium sediminicola TaxID=2024550 RepID=A0ABU9Z2Y7_9RHOO